MNVPIDITMFVTTVAGAGFLGLTTACAKLWADVQRVKDELATVKIATVTQASELRNVSDVLTEIRTDLNWIKQKLNEVRP